MPMRWSTTCPREVRGHCVVSEGLQEAQSRAQGGGQAGRRSEERRVGEEWRSRGAADHLKKKKKYTGILGQHPVKTFLPALGILCIIGTAGHTIVIVARMLHCSNSLTHVDEPDVLP